MFGANKTEIIVPKTDVQPSVPGGLLYWINYSESCQAPYTPSISLIKSLNNEIKSLKNANKIF